MDKKDTMKENKKFYFAYQISTQPQYSYSQQAIDFIYDEIKKAPDTILDKIPLRIEKDDEKAIVIYDQKTGRVTTISEESEIIKSLSEKIDIMSLYCDPKKSQEAYEIMKKINEE